MDNRVPRVKSEDYKKEDDSEDWTAYRKARIENGEICHVCQCDFIIFPKGRKWKCGDCKRLEEDQGEVTSRKFVRCPKCGLQWDPYHSEEYDLFEDGDHDSSCECGCDFRVSTNVTHAFTSPPRIQEEGGKEPEEDEAEE
ncbi:hypothetical protein LCGC14_0317630 [marine sediment metagenome]|uniref:Uncharacterized protein n=1 Tax=marine sediment metagenome TaxID=412755 RepID=A0A0F9TQ96_9ZZZZ